MNNNQNEEVAKQSSKNSSEKWSIASTNPNITGTTSSSGFLDSTSKFKVQYNNWYVNKLGSNAKLKIVIDEPIFGNRKNKHKNSSTKISESSEESDEGEEDESENEKR